MGEQTDVPVRHTCDVTVVDPDDVAALLLTEVLTAAGHLTRTCDLARVLTSPASAPVLIIADPGYDGPATATLPALRRLPAGTHATVLVITGTADPSHAAALYAAGADHVLARPWSPALLRAVVGAALRRHHVTCVTAAR